MKITLVIYNNSNVLTRKHSLIEKIQKLEASKVIQNKRTIGKLNIFR